MVPLATSREVAEYLKVHPQTMDRWASAEQGPPFSKINGQRRYDWADVKDWVEARKAPSRLLTEREVRRNLEELLAKGLVDYDPATDRYRINALGRRALEARKEADR